MSAKLLLFFELCKSSVKKMPLMSENTIGDFVAILMSYTEIGLLIK